MTTEEEQIITAMLATCSRCGYSEAITEQTIKIRRDYGLKIPDAIIAASALSMNLPLLTADVEFAKVKELDCFILEL